MNRLVATLAASALALLIAPAASAAPTTWAVDKSHSEVGFKVRHLVISKVRGNFNDFTGVVTLDDKNPKNNKISAFIAVNSIDTGNEQRDGHLKSPDFFLAKEHPGLNFVSTRFKKAGDGFEVFGKLTMRGVTKPIMLMMEGPSIEVKDNHGNAHRAFVLEGKINRKDWGLAWSKTVEGTGAVVGDEIELEIEIELFDKGGLKHDKKGKKLKKK